MAAATWILVLTLVGAGASGSPAITNVPGYASKADCIAAGKQYKAATILGTQEFVCIPGPAN
jgi:hypothetical protein